MKSSYSSALFVVLVLLVSEDFLKLQAQTCQPSGAIKGIKLLLINPTLRMNRIVANKGSSIKHTSAHHSSNTKAYLTINSFPKGGDGGGPSEYDNQYHSDDTLVVALSTGWYKGGSRCLKNIVIHGNGRRVVAKVVDEYDSTMGCDSDHDSQPPCPSNTVDASKAVWEALGVSHSDWGGLDITWTDA